MNSKTGVFLLLLLIIAAENIFAQDSAPTIKDNSVRSETEQTYQIGEVRGNVKRKAIYLPKPLFPREAMEAGAEGIVKVQVLIDADGNVVSATAISGHPLLKNAAEETALKTKFRKAETADQNAKESGVIIYNFAIEKAGWVRIGNFLAVIQKAPTLRPFNIPAIAKAFLPEWTAETEMLAKLGEMRRVEIETQNSTSTDNKPVLIKKTDAKPDGSIQKTIIGEIRVPVVNPPTAERIALSQNLITALQSRLANDEPNLWKFNLGVSLIQAFELYRNPNTRTDAAAVLRQFAENVPPEISAEAVAALRNLIIVFGKGARTLETDTEIRKSQAILFTIK